MVIVDGGDTDNFIDAELVDKINLQYETFYGFTVIIPNKNSMDCTK